MKHKFGTFFVVVVAFFTFAMALPYFARMDEGPTAALKSVMSSHDADREPVSKRQKPVLYMSWFWGSNAMASRHYVVYPDRHCEDIFVLWDHYHQMQNAPTISLTEFTALKSVPDLPQGIALPWITPSQKLLIVSRQQGSQWVTCYYDRENLPKQVKDIVAVQKRSDITERYTNLN